MFNLRHLEYLREVYRYKNFTKAAEALYVSQPAISFAVNALEAELGVKLIKRTSKNIIFTPEGEAFLYWTDRILKLCEEASSAMRDMADHGDQKLRMGISYVFMDAIAPALLKNFMAKYVNSEITINEGSMYQHIEMLQKETLDLAYNSFPENPEENGLTTIPVSTASIRLLLNPEHPLAVLPEIPIEVLGKEKLIMMDPKSKVREVVSDAFRKADVPMNIALHYSQILSVISIVKVSNYVGIISQADGCPVPGCEGLVLKNFASPLRFNIGFLMKKGRYLPKLGFAVIDFIQNCIPEIYANPAVIRV